MENTQPKTISFWEAFRWWLKLGFISFGGPTGQIAILHKELVEKRKLISENHFLQALNFCMLLPGPEAQQLCIYLGWLLHKTWGGIVAGTLFVLPAVFIMLGLSWLYAAMGTVPAVAALLYGLKPAVVAIVAEALFRISKKALKNWFFMLLAALSFFAIFVFSVPFPLIVFSAALIGFAARRTYPHLFSSSAASQANGETLIGGLSAQMRVTGWRPAMTTLAVWLTLWAAPLAAVALWSENGILLKLGILFSTAAMVTFGGAYAVLAFVGQAAVQQYGWLRPEQMMDALALAETTPGPLIMVNQFVGYVAAYLNPGTLSPGMAGLFGGLLTTWVTFVPSFLMILLFAPYIEVLRKNAMLSTALAAVTAAVVGVVLNLGVTFTWHALVPDKGGLDWYALVASIVTFYGLQYRHWPMIPVIIGSSAAGYVWKMYF
ncbi:MAG TPA: chromate efflux transporter [Dissulfurispiraceae bacterium]|nr:chromate efflux transporter [Dissulfurispiraceae bacterium]